VVTVKAITELLLGKFWNVLLTIHKLRRMPQSRSPGDFVTRRYLNIAAVQKQGSSQNLASLKHGSFPGRTASGRAVTIPHALGLRMIDQKVAELRELLFAHPSGVPADLGRLTYLIEVPGYMSSTARWVSFRELTLLPLIAHDPENPHWPLFLKAADDVLAWREAVPPHLRFWTQSAPFGRH